VILRIQRARVIAGDEARLARFVRDEAMAHALAIPGLLSFQPATRHDANGTELVVVSTWTGFDKLAAAGADLDAPVTMPGAASMLVASPAEHFELVIGEARAMPLREAKLRLTSIPIRMNSEAAYYVAVRTWADRLLDETGLVAFTLGRRVVGRQDQIVAAMLFEDEAALLDAAGADLERPMGGRELSEFWAAEPLIEHFDALTCVDPRANARAIMLADDERRYVHATPAAARLTGRPLARLLTMRVDDIVPAPLRASVAAAWDQFILDGSMRGPFVLERPDGSHVEVIYAAKANAPWPGVHASLLAPVETGEDLDLDEALVEAGLVARYAS
jgi:PAS domain-containing protein